MAVITLTPGKNGVSLKRSHNVGGVVATIGNVVAFDSSNGSLKTGKDDSVLTGDESGLQMA